MIQLLQICNYRLLNLSISCLIHSNECIQFSIHLCRALFFFGYSSISLNVLFNSSSLEAKTWTFERQFLCRSLFILYYLTMVFCLICLIKCDFITSKKPILELHYLKLCELYITNKKYIIFSHFNKHNTKTAK